MRSLVQTMAGTNNHWLIKLGDAVRGLRGLTRSRVIVIGFDARLRLLVTGLGALGKEKARLNDVGMARMTWGDTVRTILGETEATAGLYHLANISDREQIADLEIRSPVFIGRKIADLPLRECEVAALTREDIPLTAFDSVELRLGDVLTLIGERGAVGQVRESLTSL
jgi:hypothetical protein